MMNAVDGDLRGAASGRRARARTLCAVLVLAAGGVVAEAAEPGVEADTEATATAPTGAATGLHLSGFGTLGVIHVNAPAGAGFLRDAGQRSNDGGTRADIDSRLGVQADYRLSPTVDLVGQLVAANRRPRIPASNAVSMAFASYTPVDDIVLRVGRVPADNYLLADYRHVGFAYPFVRPPVEAYGGLPYAFDGGDLTKAWSFGEAVWKLRGSFGRSEVSNDRSGSRIQARPIYTLVLSQDDGNGLSFKASVSRLWLHGDTSETRPLLDALQPLTRLPVPTIAREAQDFVDIVAYEGRPVTYMAFGASLDRGPWLASLEMSHYKQAHAKGYTAAWGFIGRRVGSFLPYVGMSGVRTSHRQPPPQWQAALAPLIGDAAAAQAQALGSAAFNATLSSNAKQHTATVGVRWDFSDRMALKLQWDRVHVAPFSSRFWSTQSYEPINANIGSATLDFVF